MMLTASNYHTLKPNQEYMSVSQFKQFQKCEAMAMAEISGEYKHEQTTAMLVGSYVDAFFSGEIEDFVGNHPEIVSSRGATKGELKSEFRQAETIISRLQEDQFFMAHLAGNPQQIFTGEIAGVPFKVKTDFLQPNKIVDLKLIRDFLDLWSDDDARRVSWIRFWGYDIQGAVYRSIVEQNTGDLLPFYLAAATRESVMDKAIIRIADQVLQIRLAEVEALAPGYQAIKLGLVQPERCEHCDYCKSTKILKEATIYEGD